jgi:DNA repair protein SbcC/Rad50
LEERKARRATMAGLPAEREAALAAVQKLQKQLDNEDFAHPQRARIKSLETQVQLLGLAKQEFETVAGRISRLKDAEARRHELKTAETDWAQIASERDALLAMISAKQTEADKERAKISALREQMAQYQAVAQKTADADAESRLLQNQVNQLRSAETSYGKYLDDVAGAETEKKSKMAAYKTAKEQMQAYNALAAAFGRSGVQSLIIENAIPELEAETNDLLARMTDNAMQVRFEMTRTTKTTRSEVETLDIKVQDDVGVRPYELFSGGEGFRINFAIRIALSRLLARRSGARLQTLILDEGFGSQDGKGRERLVEVIESIKDDFAKIIVITHFEELKDSFSQRIEVIKDAGGSRIHVL